MLVLERPVHKIFKLAQGRLQGGVWVSVRERLVLLDCFETYGGVLRS